jgi:hypothetical protein
MYTYAQQALDNHITGNWGEDDCGPEVEDEIKALVAQVDRLAEELDDNNEDGLSSELITQLRKAHEALTAAYDLMQ